MFRQFFCALSVAIFSSPMILSADWTAFRGQDGNGRSPDTGLLKQWNENGPKLLWSIDFIGTGFSSVAIADGKIYISGNVEREGKPLSMVFCLDKEGNKIWEQDNGPAVQTAGSTYSRARGYPGTRGTPTISGDMVYDASALGEVTCYNAKTGEKIWSRNLTADYDAPLPTWCMGHAVVVEGDTIITPVGGTKTMAVALNKQTGEPVWEAPPVALPTFVNPERGNPPGSVAAAYTTPYLFEFDGLRIAAVMSEATLEGLDAKTGKHLFSIPFQNRTCTNCTMPVYHNGHLFLTTGYGFGAKLMKLTKKTDGTIATEEVWFEQRFDNHHGGVVLVGDYIYGTTFGGSWSSINFMTGEVGYSSRAAGKGSVHYADGLLYGLTEKEKTVLLIKPEPKEFVLISTFELPNDAEGNSWAHPVVLDGRLYLRHAQYLYCYDVKGE